MVPGTISTFATPAIGAAYLSGNREVMTMEFSPVLTLITGVALLLAVAGNTVLGLAIWRSGVLPKWAGLLWIIGTLVFYVFGAFLGMATTNASLPTQPIGALLMAVSSGVDRLGRAPVRTAQGSTAAEPPLTDQPLIERSLIMTTSAADDPYLRVVSEFDAATTPAPSHQPALLAFLLAGAVGKVRAGRPPPTPKQPESQSACDQGKAPHPIHTSTDPRRVLGRCHARCARVRWLLRGREVPAVRRASCVPAARPLRW